MPSDFTWKNAFVDQDAVDAHEVDEAGAEHGDDHDLRQA